MFISHSRFCPCSEEVLRILVKEKENICDTAQDNTWAEEFLSTDTDHTQETGGCANLFSLWDVEHGGKLEVTGSVCVSTTLSELLHMAQNRVGVKWLTFSSQHVLGTGPTFHCSELLIVCVHKRMSAALSPAYKRVTWHQLRFIRTTPQYMLPDTQECMGILQLIHIH